jgi:hypothetical protein
MQAPLAVSFSQEQATARGRRGDRWDVPLTKRHRQGYHTFRIGHLVLFQDGPQFRISLKNQSNFGASAAYLWFFMAHGSGSATAVGAGIPNQ